jgi:GDP-L-fucose synthase
MTIAVLGATGLVGRHIVEALGHVGERQIVATWHSRRPYEAGHASWIRCDLREPAAAMAALHGVDTALLSAGQISTSAELRRDPIGSVLNTLRIGTNVLEAAARLRLSRVVLISSCTGYSERQRPAVEADIHDGDPPAQWFGVGWMHRYLEKQLSWYVEHLGLIGSAVVLRPTLIYGPYDDFSLQTGHFVPTLIRKVVERARPIDIWGDGSQTRNLLHAADVAAAILAVVPRTARGLETFNVVSPVNASINEVVRHLVEIDGFSDAVITHDLARSGGPASLAVSGTALAEATGWTVRRSMREGLADTLAWYRRSVAG